MIDLEFYPTPDPFTAWLFQAVAQATGRPIVGHIFEPCVGDGAIIRASNALPAAVDRMWVTNDLDARWPADHHMDACWPELYDVMGDVDWNVSNPPFTPALAIIEQAIAHARVGVAMHLRASIHEVLKTGARRTWMNRFRPTGILWLPRFAYQRSKTTGEWTTDSVCACWVVWMKDPAAPQFIRYAPERVIDALAAYTPEYRAQMDRVMATSHAEQIA